MGHRLGRESSRSRVGLGPSRVRVASAIILLTTLIVLGCTSAPPSEPPVAPPTASPSSSSPGSSTGHDPFTLAAEIARPPFIRVEGRGGADLYVMGTVHLGPSSGWNFSPEIERGLRDADGFVMEIDLTQVDEASVGSTLASLVVLPVGTRLGDVVSPETAKLLLENEPLLARMGLPPMARDRFKPWYLAMSLVELAVRDTSYSLERSAESSVLARRGSRPLVGLETFEGQLSMLDSLSPALQDAMLRDTLGRIDDTLAEMDRLVRAWEVADRDVLREIANQGVDELPDLAEFYEILLAKRNREWIEQLDRIAADPMRADTMVFVAVGALHLVGESGLPTLFREAGYDVTRIH